MMVEIERELLYGGVVYGEDWRLWKYPSGMGEWEYRILRNGIFFAEFDNRRNADKVMVLLLSDGINAEIEKIKRGVTSHGKKRD